MTTTSGHERSKTLNNFSLPNLWGTQRHLRCVKINSNGDGNGNGEGDGYITGEQRLRRLRSSSVSDQKVEAGIKEFREKIMLDLRTVANKMTESILREQYKEEEEEEEEKKSPEKEATPPVETVEEVRPWNLRKRRASCKVIKEERVIKESVVNSSKLVYTLTKKEIEDDYMNMFGHRPPRRPKKRSRIVQKHIDLLNPASYITKITEDLYEVSDGAENVKR